MVALDIGLTNLVLIDRRNIILLIEVDLIDLSLTIWIIEMRLCLNLDRSIIVLSEWDLLSLGFSNLILIVHLISQIS
jgi:hypothetical protein